MTLQRFTNFIDGLEELKITKEEIFEKIRNETFKISESDNFENINTIQANINPESSLL